MGGRVGAMVLLQECEHRDCGPRYTNLASQNAVIFVLLESQSGFLQKLRTIAQVTHPTLGLNDWRITACPLRCVSWKYDARVSDADCVTGRPPFCPQT